MLVSRTKSLIEAQKCLAEKKKIHWADGRLWIGDLDMEIPAMVKTG